MFISYVAGLHEAAKIKEDESLKMLFESRDAVAMEVHYHPSCHKQYLSSVKNKLR